MPIGALALDPENGDIYASLIWYSDYSGMCVCKYKKTSSGLYEFEMMKMATYPAFIFTPSAILMSTSLKTLIIAGLYADVSSTMHSIMLVYFGDSSGSWVENSPSSPNNFDVEKLAMATLLNNEVTALYENDGKMATCYMA